MKALTLWQPWASLVALGVKRIETRSWSTRYRGRIAIHAAADIHMSVNATLGIGTYRVWNEGGVVWWLDNRQRDPESDQYWPLPFGAVVATADLVDCVPMAGYSGNPPYVFVGGRLLRNGRHHPGHVLDRREREWGEDQLPYGDFAPGRWAWLLDDVTACDPIPAKGRQGLWEWELPTSVRL